MTLIMQHQNHAMQLRAIAADDAGIERRDQGFPIRRFPALTSIARHKRIQNQILNDDLLIALVARTGRRVDLHLDRSRNRQLVQVAAAPCVDRPPLGPFACESGRSVALSIPDGFCGGRGGSFFNRASSSLTA